MTSRIDHLVVASPDLARDIDRCRAVGIEVVAGGSHLNGGTENAVIPLADDTYIELLAVTDSDLASGNRSAQAVLEAMECDNRLATFAVRVADIDHSQRMAHKQGVELSEPEPRSRIRPDGEQLRWRAAYPEAPGLPFLIQDETARDERIPRPHETANKALSMECLVLTGDFSTEPAVGLAALGVDSSGRPSIIVQDSAELDSQPGLHAVFLRGETAESASTVQALGEAINADLRPTLT